jgi:hypothetical protein
VRQRTKNAFEVPFADSPKRRSRSARSRKPRSTYRVRWVVADEAFGETFQTKALAESHRAKLMSYQREGVAFDEATGLPEPMARERNTRPWYTHAVAFVDMKWPHASAKHRKSIAEALAHVTPALLSTDRGAPSDTDIRRALYSWSFNKARREGGPLAISPQRCDGSKRTR